MTSKPNTDDNLGAVPKPRQPKAPKRHFETENYILANSRIINLPVRPDTPLTKRDEDRFRDIIKKIAIDLDKSNDRFFIAYRRSVGVGDKGDWWQAGGNSVLFYHHFYEKQSSLTPVNLRPDNDYGCAWPHSTYTVMIKSIKRMVAQIQEKTGASLVLDTPELIILEYPRKFSANDISTFRHSDTSRREYINKLLLPKVVNPHTYRSIIELYREIYNRVSRLDAFQRDTFGMPMANLIQSVTIDFIAMSNGEIPPLEYYSGALAKIRQLCAWLVTIQNFRVFTVDELFRIANLTEKVKGNMNNEILQLQTKSSK